MVFCIVQLNPSLLNISQLILVHPVPVYVCNDPWIFKVNESVVDKKATSGGGMENIEVGVFDPRAIEVGRGEGPSVKGGGILVMPFVPYPYKVSVFPNDSIANIPSCLCLSILIEEDNGIEMRLSPIIPHPPFARVVGVLEVTSKGGGKVDRFGRGCGSGDSGLVLCKVHWLITVNAIFAHVRLGEV